MTGLHDIGYEEGASLDYMIEFAIGCYDGERHHIWASRSPDEMRIIEAVHQLGGTIVESVRTLTGDATVANAIHDALRIDDFREILIEELQIHCGRTYSLNTAEKARRYLDLLRLVVDERPSRQVVQYLERASACYIVGFDSECTIMCRSALEAAFRDRIGATASPQADTNLSALIQRAKSQGRITSAIAKTANIVRLRGNTAVHNDPNAIGDSIGTVKLTMQVVAGICT